jgi:phage terminase small subunit
MMQRDYLVRQAELFGQALGIILSKLLKLKTQEEASNYAEITNQMLIDDLELDINDLIVSEPDDMIRMLTTEKQFANGELEKLADIFFILAEDMETEEKIRLNKRCLAIYEYVEEKELSHSYNRHWKMEKLRTSLI